MSARARASTQQDWSKLVKIMSFILGTKNEALTLSAEGIQNPHWHADAALGVYPDMKSHTSGTFRMGFGAMSSSSTKQKVNSRSSREAELISACDETSKVTWSKRFS